MVSSSHDGTIRIWTISDGREIRTLGEHRTKILALATSSDGALVVSGSEDRVIRIWSTQTGRLQREVSLDDRPTALAFAPGEGITILIGTYSGRLILWSPDEGEFLGSRKAAELSSHYQSTSVNGVAYAPDGKLLVAAYGDFDSACGASVWTADLSECTFCFEPEEDIESGVDFSPYGHVEAVTSVVFTPNGRQVITGSEDRTVRIWNTQGGEQTRVMSTPESAISSLALSPLGQELAIGLDDGSLCLFSTTDAGGDEEIGPPRSVGHKNHDSVWSLEFSPDGKTLASGGTNNTVLLWSVESARGPIDIAPVHFWAFEGGAENVSFSPDGRLIVSRGADGVRIWECETLGLVGKLKEWRSSCLGWFRDNQRIATASENGFAVWDARTGSEIVRKKVSNSNAAAIAISPNGTVIAAGLNDGEITLLAYIGDSVVSIPAHKESVLTLAWSMNGRFLAAGSKDKSITIWDVKSQRCVRKLNGHRRPVENLAFVLDGERLVSGDGAASERSSSVQGTVRIWNLVDGSCEKVIEGVRGRAAINALAEDNAWRRSTPAPSATRNPVDRCVFPMELRLLISSPSSGTWAGADNNHVYLLRLEDG